MKFRKDDIVQLHSLKSEQFNGLRAKIVADPNDDGRFTVKLYIDDHVKQILVKPNNIRKADDIDHFGFWGCSGCGAECNCYKKGSHSENCHHTMNTYRKKGPLCPGTLDCFWVKCCLSKDLSGPCLSISDELLIPTYPYPEREWVKLSNGEQVLQPKKWPYI
mmetsp:Transcript_18492/g.16747  ORF Transcript_18492/g.16747 Transcript_18492/m.16747 type:complete len:162 (+) Transcript_18492:137-622(+)